MVVSWEQREGFPVAVELAGTLDYTGWLAAPTGVFTLRTLDADRVRAHNVALARLARACATSPETLDFNPTLRNKDSQDPKEGELFGVARPPEKLTER